MKFNIRLLYLYLFSFVGLIVTTIGLVRLVNLGLQTYIFTDASRVLMYPTPAMTTQFDKNGNPIPQSAEEQQKQQEEQKRFEEAQNKSNKQREATEASAMIIVGIPLYIYHWRIAQKEKM